MTRRSGKGALKALARPRRVVALFGLVSVGALAVLAGLALRFSSEAARDQARGQVEAAAAASSVAVRQEMRGMADLVASVAGRPSLIAALSSGAATSVEKDEIGFHLDALRKMRPAIGIAFVASPNGSLLDIVPATPSIIGQDFSYRDWYRGVIRSDRPYVSEVYQTAASGGGLVVGVAAPIRASIDPKGAMIGILVVGYRLDSIQKFVTDFSAAQGVAMTIVDQRGMQVASPGAVSTELISWSDDPQVTAALSGGVSGNRESSRDGRGFITAYAPIEDLRWAVVAELSTSRALSGWSAIRNGIVSGTIILGLAVLVALVLLDRTLRRRVKVEGELRRSQVFLDSVIENIPTMVFVKDAEDLRFVRINKAGEELLGHSRAEMLGRNDFDLFAVDKAEFFVSKDREVLDRGELVDIPAERIESADGTERILHTRKIPIRDPDGRPEYLLGISHDVTEQHHAKDALDAARRAADSANNAKSEFLSRMSHELRTPLNAVLGFGQLLQLGDISVEQRVNVDHIVSAGRHLLALIDEVLDLSRVESGQLQMSLEPVCAADVVDQAVGMMRPLADARGLRVVVETDRWADIHVRADRQRLKQVCVNLLANAVKYNRDGGEIRVALDPVDDGLRLTVADTGIGIAKHDLDRLFVPFERLGARFTTVEGTGLGLTLTKQLVEAMAGEIGVSSKVGIGTSFWVRLPQVASPADTGLVTRDAIFPTQPRSYGSSTILYIEDNISNVKLVERIVASRPNTALLVAMLGRLGLDLAHEHSPTMILLDLHLPDIPGEEVLRRLRADERTATTPIVVLSADATPGQVRRLLESGATDYMTKPFDIPRLLSMIDGHFATGDDAVDVAAACTSELSIALDSSIVAALHELGELSADGPEQLRQLVEVFLHDAATRLTELATAADEGNDGRTADLAHSLAGSSANLGARGLAEMCRELEREARSGGVDAADSKLAVLIATFEEVRIALQAEFLDTPEEASR